MAVSKRTRYEVLRRDNYTCRYCRSTDNKLTVDHVTPVALGGTDAPANLVAACADCNAGKASSSPDSQTIATLTDEQVRYERARASVVARMEAAAQAKHEDHEAFLDEWTAAMPNGDLPKDWRSGVTTWLARGLSIHRLIEAIHLTAGRKHVPAWAKYAYMAKIAWNWITELEDAIQAELSGAADASADEMPCACSPAALLSDRLLAAVVDRADYVKPAGVTYIRGYETEVSVDG